MDEISFAIGVIGKSRMTLRREVYEAKRFSSAIQDGSREWVTVLAAICADESTLPLGFIFAAASKDTQSVWIENIKTGYHSVYFTTSPSDSTNNDVSLSWLEQVFDRYNSITFL
jgi:hypothetical protein